MPPLKFINAGGSLTLSAVLLAALWVARAIRQQRRSAAAAAPRPGGAGGGRFAAQISATALGLLVRRHGAARRESADPAGSWRAGSWRRTRRPPLRVPARGAQVQLQAVPHVVLDVRSADEQAASPLPAWLAAAAVAVPEPQLAAALTPPFAAWPGADGGADGGAGGAPPSRHHLLVVVGGDAQADAQAAARAAAAGYDRVATVTGGAAALAAHACAPPRPAALPPGLRRDALALLLDVAPVPEEVLAEAYAILSRSSGPPPGQQPPPPGDGGPPHGAGAELGAAPGGGHAGGGGAAAPDGAGPARLVVLDVRRHDERALYGAIPGALHLPADELPSALALPGEAFRRRYHYARPARRDALVLASRRAARAAWAAQLAADAGWQRCGAPPPGAGAGRLRGPARPGAARCALSTPPACPPPAARAGRRSVHVYLDGAWGWRFSAAVQAYQAYAPWQPPPEPEAFAPDHPDVAAGAAELQAAGLLAQLVAARAAGAPAGGRVQQRGAGGLPLRCTGGTGASEAVTRSVLGAAWTLMAAGVAPSGVAAFAAASEAASVGPDLPSSLRVTFAPMSGQQAEALSDALLGFGAQSVVLQEARAPGAAEQEVFGAESGVWDSCEVLAHFALEEDVHAVVATARDILGLAALPFDVEAVVDQEWVAQIKASYVPVQVCERLSIVPDWCEPGGAGADAGGGAPGGGVRVRLTPGIAFGTGEHPTTKLCLRHLAGLPDLHGQRVVDYGCGSGVLAIAALLLGAASAVGTDTDPLAVRAAEANAVLNGVQGRLTVVRCGASLHDPDPLLALPAGAEGAPADLVVANILRGPLLELAPRLAAYARPGGRLALSGILAEQAPDILAAYGDAFEGFEVATEGSWALVTATRKLAGKIDARELQRALALGRLEFGPEAVDQMVRAFDTDNSRSLGFEEFQRLHFFLVNVQQSFQTFDRDRSGRLSPDEVHQALQQAGFALDQPAMMAMIGKFDPDSSGSLSLDEYIRTCLFLQTAARTFGAFDPQRTGQVHLSFNQFVYAASHVCG
ncbi:prmA [Scenedesmus sp. PABB004]|nr:prmA [Scenedesmus sp. PABB004]